MPRRRLVLAAALAVAALGAAWWLLSDGLSAEERRLVGTWRSDFGPGGITIWRLGPDRRCVWWHSPPWEGDPDVIEFAGLWSVVRGAILVEPEPSALRRAVRPLYRLLGVTTRGPSG